MCDGMPNIGEKWVPFHELRNDISNDPSSASKIVSDYNCVVCSKPLKIDSYSCEKCSWGVHKECSN